MAESWIASIKNTGTLTVFNNMSAGQWANIFSLALKSFNKFSQQTGVKYVQAKDKQAANVVMQLGAPNPTALHGATSTSSLNGEIQSAVISLPDTPQVTDFDKRGKQLTIAASQGVMQCIAVHEMIHAAGLNSNDDHGSDGVFYSPLGHQDGKLYVPEKGKNQKLMPPIRFGQTIIGNLKALW